MTHACPIPGCTEQVHRDSLMCSQHWLMVPKSVRLQVCTTWHTVQRAIGPRDEVRRRHAAYREARDAAVGVVAAALMPVN